MRTRRWDCGQRDGLPDQAVRAAPRADTGALLADAYWPRFCWPGLTEMRGLAAASSNCAAPAAHGAAAYIPLLGLALYGYVEERERTSGELGGTRLARIAAADQERGHRRSAPAALRRGRPARRCGAASWTPAMLRLRDGLGSFQSMGLIDTQGTIVCAALPQAHGRSSRTARTSCARWRPAGSPSATIRSVDRLGRRTSISRIP